MSKHKCVFIIGNSGAGKGVLAEAVAKKMGWQQVNADFGFSLSVWKTSLEILGEQGDSSFLHCLSQILKHQMNQENIVVATDNSIVGVRIYE